MWSPRQRKQHQHQQPDDTLSAYETGTTTRKRGSLQRSGKPDMPRLAAAISAPSTMGGSRAFPLDASFRSDISVLTTSSAHEGRRSWFCSTCSYRNCDMMQNICALCGCARGISKSPSGRQSILTIDSSIQLVMSSRAATEALDSHMTTCSRTTGTSVSTKVMSNTTKRRRPRTQDEEEVVQPPMVSHTNQPHHHLYPEDSDDDDDTVSIASQDTCRRGSLSSNDRSSNDNSSNDRSSNDSSSNSRNSNGSRRRQHPSKLNAEASRGWDQPAYHSSDSDSSDCYSPSRRRRPHLMMPHDDPIEQPQRRGPGRRPRHGSEDDVECECPNKPVRATEEALQLSPLPSSPAAKKGRKKKSIKDYIPGLSLRRRGGSNRDRRRSSGATSATTSTSTSTSSASSTASSSAPTTTTTAAARAPAPTPAAHFYNEDLDLELELSTPFHHNNKSEQFLVACAQESSMMMVPVPSSGFRAVTPGIYDV